MNEALDQDSQNSTRLFGKELDAKRKIYQIPAKLAITLLGPIIS